MERLLPRDLPTGPPLYLERPGQALVHLGPFVLPRRIERMRQVLANRTSRLTALVERIHDPHNVAACVRSCDAFGVQHLHIVADEDETLPLNREVSMGAQRWLSVHYHRRTEDAIEAVRAAGYRLAVTDLGGDEPPASLVDVPVDSPLCIAFGNEHEGISETLRQAADLRVQIPMHGFVESLNISVAFAVGLFHLRQRQIASSGAVGDLDTSERTALLDRWILDDVPHCRAVLAELARRSTLPGQPGSG